MIMMQTFFNIDLLKINVSNTSRNNLKSLKRQVIINNHGGTVLIDTGANFGKCKAD